METRWILSSEGPRSAGGGGGQGPNAGEDGTALITETEIILWSRTLTYDDLDAFFYAKSVT